MKKITRRKFLEDSAVIGASALLMGNVLQSNGIFLSNEFHTIIKNGMIIDGLGKPGFKGDVGIKDGIITAVGDLQNASSDMVINAKGLKVVPGFVDIHSHTDRDLILNPKAESKIRQGVTTEVAGQDGFSEGPVREAEFEKASESFKKTYGEELPWRTIGEFLDDFTNRKFALNIATLVGLGSIREAVVGYDDRVATSDELKRMRFEVEKAIDEGAIGVSTGLEYTPGSFASTEELIELTKSAPQKWRLYSTHMRNEDNEVIEAVEEAIRIGRESEANLLLSHLKVSGKTNWHKADAVLELMDKSIKEGINTHADRYTYVAYHTSLSNLYPLWSRDGGNEKFIKRLKDKSLLDSIKNHAEKKVSNLDGDWDGVLISSIGSEQHKGYQGKTIKQIANQLGEDEFVTATKIILETDNKVMMMGFGMEEKSTEQILAHPRVMISSDAGSHAPYPPMNKSIAHPRAYGTFPRAIAKYVRERKICSLEEMIKKMTSMPAEKLKMNNRGIIKKGNAADIVLFDYDKINDKATFTDSHQYPEGIPYVIVDGKVVIKNNEHTGELPGQVIRS